MIPSLTAYENILVPLEIMGIRKASEKAQALLDEVGLHERGHHYPSQLSGGEQQRVAIARAFANEPQILLADEPTGALDRASAQGLVQLLVELNREEKVTLIVVTHAVELARQMSRVLEMRDGRLVSTAATVWRMVSGAASNP